MEIREYDCPSTPPLSQSLESLSSSGKLIDEEKKEPLLQEQQEEQLRRRSTNNHTLNRSGLTATSRTIANDGIGDDYRTVHEDDDEEGDSEMRGVHARTHIPPNTICMSIPRRCLITVEMGQATPIGQAILHSDLDLDAPKHIFLMVYILWDRKINGRHSFFHPYYEILPQTLNNMPIFWTKEELAYLEGSYLLQQIQDRNSAITEDYNAICKIAPQLAEICTLDEFKWARMCVCSRNFGLQIDGHRTSALVPQADMLNHYRPRETKWTFDEERNAFTITTLQHIPAGAQVYDSYGQKCNHRFLLNYGFAVEDNRELDGFCPNEVPMELYVDPDDPLFAEKTEYWTRGGSGSGMSFGDLSTYQTNGSTNSIFASKTSDALQNQQQPSVMKRVRVCVSNNENTRLLFSLLRSLACNKEELAQVTNSASPDSLTGISSSPSTTTPRSFFGLSDVSLSSQPGMTHSQPRHHNIFSASYNNGHLTSFSVSSSGIALSSSPGVYRSCRDIRHPISLRNERAAMKLLLDIIDRHLNNYPTSLAVDIAELQDEVAFPRFSNKRHAKIQVRGEKEVLHHFAHWARTSLDVLDVIERELQEERDGMEDLASSVEVQLTQTGRMVTTNAASPTPRSSSIPGTLTFDRMIRRMEDDVDNGVHHTILRYCADVLGSLRREEFKKLRRQQRGSSSTSNEASSYSRRSGSSGYHL